MGWTSIPVPKPYWLLHVLNITLATSHNSIEGSVYDKSESLSHFRIFLHMGSYWYLHFPDRGTEAGIWVLPAQLLFMLVLLQCRGMPTTGSLIFAVNLGCWRMEWPSETSEDKRRFYCLRMKTWAVVTNCIGVQSHRWHQDPLGRPVCLVLIHPTAPANCAGHVGGPKLLSQEDVPERSKASCNHVHFHPVGY